jgi:hypothetical protein
VGIDVEVINGGFAAITYNIETESRRLRTSTDGGKTWQAIDAGLPPSKLISSIKQVGDYFYCGHPDGIYRCAVGGNFWELLLPTIGKKCLTCLFLKASCMRCCGKGGVDR